VVAPSHPRGAGLLATLARLGFTGTARAAQTVAALGLDDPSVPVADPAAPTRLTLLAALADTADPDLALSALARLADAAAQAEAGGRRELLDALVAEEGLRGRLLAVLGASAALGDHLVEHPGDWRLLADDAQVDCRPSAYGLRRTLLRAVGADPDQPLPWGSGGATAADAGPATLAALRTSYRRGLLCLAARDLTGCCSVTEVAAELADLAAAALDAALAVAAAALPTGSTPVRLAVIGMGKCGGRELNYRSDVDVVFVAEPLPSAGSGQEAVDAALRTGTQLARGLLRACGDEAGGAGLFPVDAALRPEGKAGPLVRTLRSHAGYYQRWAQSWELQALLKARPVAGDLALGASYVERLAPLVWTPAPRGDVPREVQTMRRRVETELARALTAPVAERELKLGPGGLRDVEFAVQLLQLVHGRADPTLRSGATLPALEALAEGGYVARSDAAALDAAYRFLRSAEHRLQLQRLRRTHAVPPPGDPDLRWLARALGWRRDAVAGFEAERRRHVAVVRRLHERIFYRPLLAAVARLPSAETRLTPAAATSRLEALGFSQTRQALAHLDALTSGVSRRAAIQRTLLPVLLGWFAEEADPDGGLLAFRRISDALGDTPWYLRSLRDEGQVAERLAHLVARSRYVADLLVRAPEAILALADDDALAPRSRASLEQELGAVAARASDPADGVGAVRALRRGALLRTACADLLGLVDGAGVQAALSDLAAATVSAALLAATRGWEARTGGPLPVRLAVIALGRLGGRELSYASDADVLFVHEALGSGGGRGPGPGPGPGPGDGTAAAAARAVAEETRRLLAAPAPDPPLQLDAGLRPEGRGGALSLSLAALERYHATRGQVWERQALLRAAPLAGDAGLTERFLAQVAPLRWPAALPVADVAEVLRLRARLQSERVAKGLTREQRWRDLKLGWGGLLDVQWCAELTQLRHAAAVPALRTPATEGALLAAADAGLLDRGDVDVLLAGHRQASRLRDAVVLVSGRRTDVLPEEGMTLDGVRRVAGAAAVDGWREQARAVREVAESVLRGRRVG